jgi:hypothetical protein
MAKSPSDRAPRPDEQVLTETRARWLSKQTSIPLGELRDKRLEEVHELIRPHFDPISLLFRKVCGRVVKRDPVSGEERGVPNATVDVEDTDIKLLSFYPESHPYWWAWPLWSQRETIAQVRTDACGHFCVWIPRWDVDRILRARRRLFCPPIKPNLTEIIDRYVEVEVPRKPIPDPGPIRKLPPDVLRLVGEELGHEAITRLARVTQPEAGADPDELTALLSSPAFAAAPPAPPLRKGAPRALRELEHPALAEAKRLGVEDFEPNAYLGPFLRCREEWVLEWQTYVDVPDITFRVTQDVDGDGDEETIYSEGYFDVRWDAGSIPDVTLHASSIARSSAFCGGPEEARTCDKPELYAVGELPLDPEFHDHTEGYALTVNRPRDEFGVSFEPARSPYAGPLALHACHRLPGATHQRVMYRAGDVKPVPLFVKDWEVAGSATNPESVVRFEQDPEGWVEIKPATSLKSPDCVLFWPTPLEGRYYLHVECRDDSGIIGSSDEVAFTIDNVGCSLLLGPARWRQLPSGGWNTLPDLCPVIRRPAGVDIELEVPWSADSPNFRNAHLTFTGCGGSASSAISPTSGIRSREEWHDSVADTHGAGVAFYTVHAGQPEGAYTLSLEGWTRGFQPNDPNGPLSPRFRFDPSWVHSYAWRAIAIVTEG